MFDHDTKYNGDAITPVHFLWTLNNPFPLISASVIEQRGHVLLEEFNKGYTSAAPVKC